MLAFNSLVASAGQITHTVTYDPSKLSVTYVTTNGSTYTKVQYDDLYACNQEGEPELPNDNLLFSVPYNATNIVVNIQVNDSTDTPIFYPVYPAQAMMAVDDTTSLFTQPNMAVYGMSSFYPYSICKEVSYGYLYGDNKVVSVQLFPISYNPINSTLRIYTNVTLFMDYDIDNSIIPTLLRHDSAIKAKEMAIVAQNVINGSSVIANSYTPPVLPPIFGQNPSLPTYNYCIITSRELEPAFKKIIAMKRQKGLPAGVVCMEDLMASPICNRGDVMLDETGNIYPTIADSAGVVRQYLKYAFNSPTNPTTFVLMGGTKQFAPIRYIHATKMHNKNDHHIPSDLYFSDLSQIWLKNDSDSVFGDEYIFLDQYYYDDNIDDYRERYIKTNIGVYVGRLLCKNNIEIDNYANKLHKYIFNPGDDNSSYLTRALFVSNDGFDCTYIKKQAQYIFGEHIYEIHEDRSHNYPTGEQLIDSLNISKYGFISIHTHGLPKAIVLFNDGQKQYHLTALDRYQPLPTYNVVDENNNGLDCLTNKDNPFICYSIACTTNPFDDLHNYSGLTQMEYKYNFGESFTLGEEYGGPAFLGNTRVSYHGYSDLEKTFYKCMYQKRRYSIGIAESFSKFERFTNIVNQNKFAHNLLGDPEFEMWTSEPQRYTGITINRINNYIFVNGISASDTIAYCDNDGNVNRKYGSSGLEFFNGVSPTASIMVYNHDHIPYIAPMKFQDCNINNSQYVYASSFSAGKNILPNVLPGNVIVKNGAVYEIEATDDVLLGEGFIVESGAAFAIKTPGKVTIDGCVFQSGAKVKIEAGKVEVAGKFTAKRGSKVEFTQYVE